MPNDTKLQEETGTDAGAIDSAGNMDGGFFASDGYIDNDSGTGEQSHQDDVDEIEHTDDAMQNETTAHPTKTKNAVSAPKRGMGKSTKIMIGAGVAIALFGFVLLATMQQQSGEPLGEQLDAEMSINNDPHDVQQDVIADAAPASADVAASDPFVTVADAATPVGQGMPNSVASMLDEQDTRFRDLESRVTHIEESLAQLAKQQAAGRKKTTSTKKTNTAKMKTNKVNQPCSVKPHNKQGAVATIRTETVSAAPVVVPTARAICTYLGALNNRAWVSCDGDLYSIKRGDILPYPYGAVTVIDDSSGSVTTSGGVIR